MRGDQHEYRHTIYRFVAHAEPGKADGALTVATPATAHTCKMPVAHYDDLWRHLELPSFVGKHLRRALHRRTNHWLALTHFLFIYILYYFHYVILIDVKTEISE